MERRREMERENVERMRKLRKNKEMEREKRE